MKKSNKITLEITLYGLIFLAALALRFFQLGWNPLLESEARWALQAWQLTQNELIPVGSQVAYLAFSEGLFTLFGSGNFLARVWPALVGSTLVWLPYLFRTDLKRVPALIIAAGLALDPVLVPASRLAGSLMPSLVFLLWALGTLHTRKITWFLVFLILGLLSGPAFWMGLFCVGIVILFSSMLGLFEPADYFSSRTEVFKSKPQDWLPVCIPALLVLVIMGSFFLRDIKGLSAWVGAFPEFIRSWGGPVELGIGKFLVYFLLNNPLILVFGLAGFLTAWRVNDLLGQMLSIWFSVTLLVLMIYPGRGAVDLAWLAIPLWITAATEFVRLLRLAATSWVTYVLSGIVLVLASLNWLTFIGMIFQGANQNAMLLELGLLLASLALVILSATIVTSEWGWPTASKGLVGGVALTLFLYLIASLSLDTYLVSHDPRSIFSDGTGSGQMELLRKSIADVSITATGRPDSINGAVISDNQALRWALRDFEEIGFLVSPPTGIEYPILITMGQNEYPIIQENYRGQDFVLSTRSNWGRILPDDWISWIAFRKGPVVNDYLILWVRNDIYSGY